MKTANKILEELGAWLMAVTFIFIVFKFIAFIVGNVEAGKIQSGSYSARANSHPLQDDFKSDTMEMKAVLLK